jgi:hypothetical protein
LHEVVGIRCVTLTDVPAWNQFCVIINGKPRWLAESRFASYIAAMNWLTKQEQLIICLVISLLVTGLAVKYYRAAHPAVTSSQPVKP